MTKRQPRIHCILHQDTGLVEVAIDDGDNVASVILPADEARETFSRMFNVAASAKDYAK